MATVFAPFGLRPLHHPDGQVRPFMLRQTKALMEATPTLFQNTPVAMDATGRLAVAAQTGADFIGTFQGVEYFNLADGTPTALQTWVNGTTVQDFGNYSARVYFTRDPLIYYQIQSIGSLPISSPGEDIDFSVTAGSLVTSGNSTTGQSATACTATPLTAGVQGQLRIMKIDESVDNDWGDAFTRIIVQVARHQDVANKVGF
jgi:hypothetical protein